MKHWGRIAAICGCILVGSGCTQDPAEVSYKGDEFFGRVHEGALDAPNHETFPEDSPRIKPGYSRPVEQAKVQPVGISDLAPPSSPPVGISNARPAGAPPVNTDSASAQASERPHFIWPVSDGKIISRFGPKSDGRSNDGVNVALAEGEPIWAAAAGTVVYGGSDLKGYGNMIIVRHEGGWMTAYAHARSIAIKKNDKVKQGDIIAYVGSTGGVPTPQLHFAIRNGKTPVDPELYLPKSIAGK